MGFQLLTVQPIAVLIPSLVAVSLLLHFMEFRFRKKWLFMILNAVFFTASVVALLVIRATLSELLLLCIAILIVRVAFTLLEGREKH